MPSQWLSMAFEPALKNVRFTVFGCYIRASVLTEADMLHLLSYVRQSMTSCRRIQPIPQDFEHGLRSTYTPVAALQPHLKPLQRPVRAPPASSISPSPSSPSQSSFLAQKQRSLPTPPPDTEEEPIIQPRDFSFLGDELNATEDRLQNTYIPKHFPNFPSKHTYQETPVFATKRELNPEKLREQATEEGKLGEEALRKLTRAGKDVHPGSRERQAKTLWGKDRENMDSMFDKTLKALLKRTKAAAGGSIGGMKEKEKEKAGSLVPELGPIVNNDRMYWRKPGVGGTASGGRK